MSVWRSWADNMRHGAYGLLSVAKDLFQGRNLETYVNDVSSPQCGLRRRQFTNSRLAAGELKSQAESWNRQPHAEHESLEALYVKLNIICRQPSPWKTHNLLTR
jgi:hypothetical protein